MINKFYYKVYGLTIQSDIEILGALPCEEVEKADVSLRVGEVPAFLKEGKEKGYKTWTNGKVNAWFLTPEAGEFYVEKGNLVIVEPMKDANWDLLGSMFLSAAMCLIILQRQEMVFHGSTISYKEQGIIISGASGAGKSTVTMELLKNPYGFVADDTVRVHEKEGIFVVEPSYPQQKLCKDMALQLGLKLEKLRYIDEERDKYAVLNLKQFVNYPLPLKLMVVLKVDKEAKKVYSKRLTGQQYIETMIQAFYLEHVYREIIGTPMEIVKQVLNMYSQMSLYEVYRPKEGNTIKEVCSEIQRLMEETL